MRKTAAFLGVLFCVALMGASVQADEYTVINSMNFRSAPSALGQSIGAVPKGSTVTYLGTSDGWDYVSVNGTYGWIHGGNLISGELPAAMAANTQINTNTQPAVTSTTSTTTSTVTGTSQKVTVLYGMNFRATPGMTGTILNTVPAGSTVQYLGSSNGWDKVIYNGVEGWIASGRISTQTASSATASASTSTAAAATGSSQSATVLYGMNFRATPGMTGTILNTVPAGSTVQYLGSSNGWDRVIYNGVEGWIASGRITTASAAQTASAAASYTNTNSYTTTSVYGSGKVGAAMNFRATPGLTGSVMGIVPTGSAVQVISSSNGWDKVVYQGVTGWIKSGNVY